MSAVNRGAPALQRATMEIAVRSSSSTARSPMRRPVIGARIDTSSRYTETGGSGLDSTSPSKSLEERKMKVRALYHAALRDIDNMRINYFIVEGPDFMRRLIRNLFEGSKGVDNPKIADVLIFKATQELGEIRNQYKGRHQIATYIARYWDKIAKENAEHVQNESRRANPPSKKGSDQAISDLERGQMLQGWKDRGLVPADIYTWEQYQRWKADDNARFAQFAVDSNLFDADALRQNADMKSKCSIM